MPKSSGGRLFLLTLLTAVSGSGKEAVHSTAQLLTEDAAITDNQLDCKVSTREYFVDQGHCAISLHLAHRPKLQRDPLSVKHEVIPTQAFLLTQGATSESQHHQHAKHLSFLHRLLAQQCHDPASINPAQDGNCTEGGTLVPSSGLISDRSIIPAPVQTAGRGTLVRSSPQFAAHKRSNFIRSDFL